MTVNYTFINLVLAFIFFFDIIASFSMWEKVDLHIASGYVYFTDNGTSTSYKGIFRSKTDGGYYSMVVHSGVGNQGIQGIAVDWIAGMKPLIHFLFLLSLMQSGPKKICTMLLVC